MGAAVGGGQQALSHTLGDPRLFSILLGKKHFPPPRHVLAGLAGCAGWLGWLVGWVGWLAGWVGWVGWLAGLAGW